MAVQIVYETHSTSVDNERGISTGWLPGQLSPLGRQQAELLGQRRRSDGLAVVLTSDLRRAVETAEIAFGGTTISILHDWRLRECNYGDFNGISRDQLHENRLKYLDTPYPNGESWRQAVARVGRVWADLTFQWPNQRVLLIGHVATRWACQHFFDGTPLEELIESDFAWQEGWAYRLD